MQQPKYSGRQAGARGQWCRYFIVSWPAIHNPRDSIDLAADNTEEDADSPTMDEGAVEPEVVEKSPEEIRAEEEKLFTEDDEGHDYSLDFLSINEDDSMYAVPEDDTADFVGIGSLGHIIRKCFKELYRPGQDEDDMLMKKVKAEMEGVDGEKSQTGDSTLEAASTENVDADQEAKEEKKDGGDEDTVDEVAGEERTEDSHEAAWKRPKKKARLQGASLTRPDK